ncbi:MAG: ABC transporter permease [Clostridiales bacterium]|jgi:ribose/xylose/arabinose/galactoside ABC-type transport system permease subunit|nr:ABC transporter permease [Clostridiales bacterium]OPZ67877.1 MAG: Ribose transport system permease protein RbsC [Firmicutes bacterium ADurb.Bin467]
MKPQSVGAFSVRGRGRLKGEGILGLLILAILLLLYIFGGGTSGFFGVQNIVNVLRVFSYLFIAGIGMTMIIITRNIDISYGAVISVIAIVMAAISKTNRHLPFYAFLPVGMLVGMLLCGFNAWMMATFKIPSMVITLATTQIYYGALLLFLDGSIYNLRSNWTWFTFKANLFNYIPLSVVIALALLVASILFFKYSRFVRRLYAIGNNRQGAVYAGINVNRTMIITYVIGGALLSFSSATLATQGSRVTCTVGNNVEMNVIAAVVVGGTSAVGGSGKIYGTALGALLLAIISPALAYVNINTYFTNLVTGAIIVIAVATSALKNVEFRFGKKSRIETRR